MDVTKIVSDALTNALTAEAYGELLQTYGKEGKTSGEQKEDLVYYTRLNAQRSKRIAKTTKIDDKLVEKLHALPRQTWLVISETWCGDAANTVPIISLLANLSKNIELKVVFRDEHPDLMDQFLTKGGRSIPKLIALDAQKHVLFDWGPRPKEAQELYWNWRESENRMPYTEFHLVLQKWYNDDRGKSTLGELEELIDKTF